MGFATMPALRAQGADDVIRTAARARASGAHRNGRRIWREGRVPVHDRSACGAAGAESGAAGENNLRPRGRHGGDTKRPSSLTAAPTAPARGGKTCADG